MKTVIVAVSGGVDSVCLLHMMVRSRQFRPVVVHVDHGMRSTSADDARFVRALAASYTVPCHIEQVALGSDASEEAARNARYEVLLSRAKQYSARVATAHHKNDLVETVAINCARGTGWRGLTVLARDACIRPLLHLTKQQLYEYALQHGLEWVEDETNNTTDYLRNRLRLGCQSRDIDAEHIAKLRSKQLVLRTNIERECERLATAWADRRYPYIAVERWVAAEVMRVRIFQQTTVWLDRKQAMRAVDAVRVGKKGARFDIGGGVKIVTLSDKYIVDKV